MARTTSGLFDIPHAIKARAAHEVITTWLSVSGSYERVTQFLTLSPQPPSVRCLLARNFAARVSAG